MSSALFSLLLLSSLGFFGVRVVMAGISASKPLWVPLLCACAFVLIGQAKLVSTPEVAPQPASPLEAVSELAPTTHEKNLPYTRHAVSKLLQLQPTNAQALTAYALLNWDADVTVRTSTLQKAHEYQPQSALISELLFISTTESQESQ